jgi:glutathione peroxidase-family protein
MPFTLSLNQKALDFDLPGVDGKRYSLASFKNSKLLIIVFSCNHCPFVIGSEDRLNKLFADYSPKGVAMAAINSNETEGHPNDSMEHMIQRAKDKNPLPYLRDTQQQVVAYGACTPISMF